MGSAQVVNSPDVINCWTYLNNYITNSKICIYYLIVGLYLHNNNFLYRTVWYILPYSKSKTWNCWCRSLNQEERDAFDKAYFIRILISNLTLISSIVIALLSSILFYFKSFEPRILLKIFFDLSLFWSVYYPWSKASILFQDQGLDRKTIKS